MTDRTPVLSAQGLSKRYQDGARTLEILRQVHLDVYPGEMVAIMGASGSGKSTLMHILGMLDTADEGELWIAGESMAGRSEKYKSRVRNESLGFVYQFHHLLQDFSALDNVAMPLLARRMNPAKARAKAQAMLEKVGLGDRGSARPGQLSGGERQRVAMARALVTEPLCVLADEPTGNLDQETAHQVLDLLKEMNQQFGTAFVIVTHDPQLAALADRTLRMERGQLS